MGSTKLDSGFVLVTDGNKPADIGKIIHIQCVVITNLQEAYHYLWTKKINIVV